MILRSTSGLPRTTSRLAFSTLVVAANSSALRLLQRALERPRIDHEQQIALLDALPVLEPHLGEIAGDARTHLHRLDGVETAGVLVPLDDLALNGLAHGHGRRRALWLRLRLRRVPLVAPGAQRQERDRGHQRAGAATVTPAIEHAGHSSGEVDLQTNTQQSRAAKAAAARFGVCSLYSGGRNTHVTSLEFRASSRPRWRTGGRRRGSRGSLPRCEARAEASSPRDPRRATAGSLLLEPAVHDDLGRGVTVLVHQLE